MSTTAAEPTILDAALQYAERDWEVFPVYTIRDGRCTCGKADCDSPGKHPWTRHGFKDATVDRRKIRRWWKTHPDLNIGVRTGETSDIVVLDVDSYNGGDESLDALEHKHGELPETVEAITGGGGRHLVYRHPRGGVLVPNSSGKLGPGIDVRGDGGYIVVEPSMHKSGRRYRWELSHLPSEHPIAPMPAWLLEIIRAKPEAAGPTTGNGQAERTVGQGRRNTTLTGIAGVLRRRGMDGPEIEAAIGEINRRRCRPPLEDAEVAKIAASVARYDPVENVDDLLPVVAVNGRPLRDVTADVVELVDLANDPPGIFVRNGSLARVRRDENDKPIVDVVGKTELRHRVAETLACVKVLKGGDRQHVHPPDPLVENVLAEGSWPFPALVGFTEVPVIRPDGTALDQPGYDPATRLVYLPDPTLRIPPIPEGPDQDAAKTAAKIINDELLADFRFADQASRANAIGTLVSPVLRPAIEGQTPLGIFTGRAPGEGKGLLTTCVSIIATGRPAAVFSEPQDEAEWRKQLTATLMSGATVVVIDNVTKPLSSASLAAAVTAPTWSDRILGVSRNADVPVRVTWIVTGNNVQVGGDNPRRCYWVRLDAGVVRPWQRKGFKHELPRWAFEHRGELIAAVLTMARAWHVAGRPTGDITIGGFESWATMVGGVLAYAEVEGFLGNFDDMLKQADDDGTAWWAFLSQWDTEFTDETVTTAQVEQRLRSALGADFKATLPPLLLDAFENANRSFARSLGRHLAAIEGRRFDDNGLRIVRAGMNTKKIQQWRVVGDG